MTNSTCYIAHHDVHSDIACYIALLYSIAGVLYSKGVIWQIRCYVAVTPDSRLMLQPVHNLGRQGRAWATASEPVSLTFSVTGTEQRLP